MAQAAFDSTEYELAVRLERLRVTEALNARDIAVERLAQACASVRAKSSTIECLEGENGELQEQLDLVRRALLNLASVDGTIPAGTATADKTAEAFSDNTEKSSETLENQLASLTVSENVYTTGNKDDTSSRGLNQESSDVINPPGKLLSPALHVSGAPKDITNPQHQLPYALPTPLLKDIDLPDSPWTPLDGERLIAFPTANTAEKIEARYAVLASLPLPSGIPDDALSPIIIPTPHTLHDFMSTTSGHLRSQIGNYRVFQESTTTWCPEREEHGYYLTPAFKCNTNPRVSTAHRWSAVDLAAKLDKPTECFYNKDGKWYYAGVYKSFRLEDLCPQEWECLSTETSQALIKETLAGRKNTSPQNVYETGQLYAAGALKVACIGLQCIGFNDSLYRALLEHAAQCMATGKWRAAGHGHAYTSSGGTGLGFGSPAQGTGWNVNTSAMPLSPPAGISSPIVSYCSPAAEYCSPGAATGTPGSPIVGFGSPGQRPGRSPGLLSVPPGVRNIQHGF